MARFLVDEDLPRSLAGALRAAGHEAVDVREASLRGEADRVVFQHAQGQGMTVLTGDLEFANEIVYPPKTHQGVVLVRYPNDLPAPMLVQEIVRGIAALAGEDLVGTIVVLEPGRARLRRPPP